MIKLENVSFGYGLKKNVISDLSLAIPEGSRLCISAPSGAGKTTLLRLILGLEKPRRGTVELSEDLSFSAVFQEDRLIPHLTLLQNTALFSDTDSAQKLLAELGLADSPDLLPAELSGGMKRRAALARALCHSFDVLVLDEAFTGLDAETAELCLTAVDRAAHGKTIIMATHNPYEAEFLKAETVRL